MDGGAKNDTIRVLLVEDNRESGEALYDMLERRGLAVTLVSGGAEAVRIFRLADFDAVVTDIRMPEVDGVDVLRHVRRSDLDFPVILLTGYDTIESAITAVRLGAHDYILKPLNEIEDLLIPVQQAVRAHRAFQDERRLREELVKSESKYRAVFENAGDQLILLDRRGVILDANDKIEAVFGIGVDKIIGKGFWKILSLFGVKGKRQLLDIFMGLIGGKNKLTKWEVEGRHRNGKPVVVEASTTLVRNGGKIIGLLAVVRDITERKRTENALRESEARFRTMFEGVNDGILLADPETKQFTLYNDTICRMLGYTKQEMGTLAVADIHPKKYLAHVIREFEKQTREAGYLARDIPVLRKDGTVFYADVNAARISLAGKDYLMGVFRDITERKQSDERITEVSARERERIGQDLHDGVCQELSGVGFLLKDLEMQIAENLPDAAVRAAEIGRMISTTADVVKQIARGLYPVESEPDGLMSALEELASRTHDTLGWTCRFESGGEIAVSDNNVSNQLYYIAQEAVNNAIRHAAGRTVEIALSESEKALLLVITNDGRKLPDVADRGKGLGITIMGRRAASMGAALEVRAGKKEGTVVEVRVPNAE